MIGRGQWKEILRMIAALAVVLVAGFTIRTLEADAVTECSETCLDAEGTPALDEQPAPALEGRAVLRFRSVERRAGAPMG